MSRRKLDLALTLGIVLEVLEILRRTPSWLLPRCVAALRGHADAEDVAQDVKLRLLREAQAGKTYAVPYRVVVHKVIQWTLKDRPTPV